MSYLLGIDIGTGSVKVAIIDKETNLLAKKSHEYRINSPKPGYVEINSGDMWNAFLICLREIFSDNIIAKDIQAIGIACLCPGLTAFDSKGKVLIEPILYSDQRSIEEADILRHALGEDKFFSVTGNNIMAGAISSTSMLWVKRKHPEIYSKVYKFGHVNTLMAYLLTGVYAIDPSNASYTGLFETTGNMTWSKDFCEAMEIDSSRLPQILRSEEVVGGLVRQELIDFGFQRNIPVVIGGADTACASLAAGVVDQGDICESVGTTNVLTVCVNKPVFNRAFINRCHVVKDRWLYHGAMSYTGAALKWFRDEFCRDLEEKSLQETTSIFSLMEEEAAQSSPGAGGVVFLPYMMGERSPVWDPFARGVFAGLSLQTRRADMLRAVLEACGYGLRQLSEKAEEVTEYKFSEFISIGGGAKNELWAQIKADITGKDICILDINDAAPVGAAILAGAGCGIFSDTSAAAKKIKKTIIKKIHATENAKTVYDTMYRKYIALYPMLKNFFRM